jgi:hypothetical protein
MLQIADTIVLCVNLCSLTLSRRWEQLHQWSLTRFARRRRRDRMSREVVEAQLDAVSAEDVLELEITG